MCVIMYTCITVHVLVKYIANIANDCCLDICVHVLCLCAIQSYKVKLAGQDAFYLFRGAVPSVIAPSVGFPTPIFQNSPKRQI